MDALDIHEGLCVLGLVEFWTQKIYRNINQKDLICCLNLIDNGGNEARWCGRGGDENSILLKMGQQIDFGGGRWSQTPKNYKIVKHTCAGQHSEYTAPSRVSE